MNAPGMLHVATSLYYLEYIMQDSNMYPVATVDELLSSFVLYNIFFIKLVHPQPLIFTQSFCFNTIIYQSTFSLSSFVRMF